MKDGNNAKRGDRFIVTTDDNFKVGTVLEYTGGSKYGSPTFKVISGPGANDIEHDDWTGWCNVKPYTVKKAVKKVKVLSTTSKSGTTRTVLDEAFKDRDAAFKRLQKDMDDGRPEDVLRASCKEYVKQQERLNEVMKAYYPNSN